MPIKNVSVLWGIYKQLLKRIFLSFFVLVHGSGRVTVHPPPMKVRDKVFLLIIPPPISKVDAIK